MRTEQALPRLFQHMRNRPTVFLFHIYAFYVRMRIKYTHVYSGERQRERGMRHYLFIVPHANND